jgi:hypothetical protein
MKLNWGYKIMLVYVVFVCGIVFLVIKSFNEKVDLVTPDYYGEELKHQHLIDEKLHTKNLSSPVKYEISNHNLQIHFPKDFEGKTIDGNLTLYCTADVSKDHSNKFHIATTNWNMAIPNANKGLHEIHLTWQTDSVQYYFEDKVLL